MDKGAKIKISFLAFCLIIFQIAFFLPIPKIAAYILPSFLLFLYMAISKKKKTHTVTISFFIIIILYFIFNSFAQEDFFISNYITAIVFNITGVFLIFFHSHHMESSSETLIKKFLIFFLAIQVFIGLFQVVMIGRIDGAEGDFIQGSLQWNSFKTRDSGGFNNQIYAIALINITLFLLRHLFKSLKWLLFLSLTAVLLTGVIHVIVCVVLSLATASVFFLPLRILNKAIISIVFLIGSIYLFLPGNFQLFSHYYDLSQRREAAPKIAVTYDTFEYLKNNPKVLFFGTGIGHYSSRASLLNSGTYNDKFDFLNKQSSHFKQVVKPIWDRFRFNKARYGNSTIHRPFYSMLSFFTEFGLLISSFILYLFYKYLKQLRKRLSTSTSRKTKSEIYILLIMIFFNLYLGVFENYYELPQAILPGVILMIILNNKTKNAILNESEI